MVILLR